MRLTLSLWFLISIIFTHSSPVQFIDELHQNEPADYSEPLHSPIITRERNKNTPASLRNPRKLLNELSNTDDDLEKLKIAQTLLNYMLAKVQQLEAYEENDGSRKLCKSCKNELDECERHCPHDSINEEPTDSDYVNIGFATTTLSLELINPELLHVTNKPKIKHDYKPARNPIKNVNKMNLIPKWIEDTRKRFENKRDTKNYFEKTYDGNVRVNDVTPLQIKLELLQELHRKNRELARENTKPGVKLNKMDLEIERNPIEDKLTDRLTDICYDDENPIIDCLNRNTCDRQITNEMGSNLVVVYKRLCFDDGPISLSEMKEILDVVEMVRNEMIDFNGDVDVWNENVQKRDANESVTSDETSERKKENKPPPQVECSFQRQSREILENLMAQNNYKFQDDTQYYTEFNERFTRSNEMNANDLIDAYEQIENILNDITDKHVESLKYKNLRDRVDAPASDSKQRIENDLELAQKLEEIIRALRAMKMKRDKSRELFESNFFD